jgi:sugar phosphate isomerase/epimerase
MQLAFRIHGGRHSDLDGAMLRAAAVIGYAGIEIAPDPVVLPPSAWTAGEAHRLRRLAGDLGLTIASLDLSHPLLLGCTPHEPSFMAPYARQRDERIALVRRGIAFAAELGAPLVSLPSGPLAPNMPCNAAMEHLIDGIDNCLGAALDHGVRLAIEPAPGQLIGSYAAFLELAQVFAGGQFGLCYDLVHGHCRFEDMAAVIADASDLLHLHLADAADRELQHLIPGEGKLDLCGILRQLMGKGYRGFVSVALAGPGENAEAAADQAFNRLTSIGCPSPAGEPVGSSLTVSEP